VHPGLVDAIAATLPGASWQRCRTHFMRNLLTRVPKSAQSFVATMVRSIFAQPDAASVHEQHSRIVAQLEERFPEAATLLEEAGPEILAFTGIPKEHWRQLWSNNSLERLNKEIRRRTDVVPRSARDRPPGWRGPRRAARRVAGRPPLHERRVDRQSARQPRRRARGGDGDRSRRVDVTRGSPLNSHTVDGTSPNSLRRPLTSNHSTLIGEIAPPPSIAPEPAF
jgi:hypothetical protein